MTSEGLGKGSCFTIEVPVSSPLSDINTLEQAVTTRETLPVENNEMSKSTTIFCGLIARLMPSFKFSYVRFDRDSNRVAEKTRFRRLNLKPSIKLDLARILPSDVATVERRSDDISYRDNVPVNDDKSSSENIDFMFNDGRKSRILIVDDVPMNRKMLKRLVMDRFDECLEAENGQQAVDMVKDAMESGMSYDIVAIDYQMPVMDGVTATSMMRAIGYTGRIIGITGNAMQEDLNSFTSSGADVVLTKPLSAAKIAEFFTTLPFTL